MAENSPVPFRQSKGICVDIPANVTDYLKPTITSSGVVVVTSGCTVVPYAENRGVPGFPQNFAPLEEFVNTPRGVARLEKKKTQYVPLGNFNLHPVAWIFSVSGNTIPAKANKIRFLVTSAFGEEEVVCPADNVQILWKEIAKIPWIKLEETGKNSNPHFDKLVAGLLEKFAAMMKQEYEFFTAGWFDVNGRKIYLSGRYDYVKSSRVVPDVSYLDKRMVFNSGFSFLAVGKTSGALEVMFLFSFLPYLFPFFSASGVVPESVLTVVGPSNSLKTSVCKELFNLFETDEAKKLFSFDSTPTALESAAKQTRHETLIIDDVAPPDGSCKERYKAALEKVAHISRLYGNGIGKARSKSWVTGENTATSVEGTAVITAELLQGSFSTRTRQLWVCVNEQTFDVKALSAFQNDRMIMRNFFALFIQFLENNYDAVNSFVQTKLAENMTLLEQRSYGSGITKPRLARSLAIMMTVVDVVGKFADYALDGEDIEPYGRHRQTFMAALESAFADTEMASNERDPVDIFLTLLGSLVEQEKVMLTKSKTDFSRNYSHYIGYFEEEKGILWLKSGDIFAAVVAAGNRQSIALSESENTLYARLKERGITICDANSNIKKTGFKVGSLNKRVNLLAIKAGKIKSLREDI